MMLFRSVLVSRCIVLAFFSGAAEAQLNVRCRQDGDLANANDSGAGPRHSPMLIFSRRASDCTILTFNPFRLHFLTIGCII